MPNLSIDVKDSEARQSLEDLEGYIESIVPVALSVTENGTYTAPTGVFGYSPVTVAVDKDFYPKTHATLDDASRVEGDDMRVYPMGGTDYYPYVYLGVRPYGSQEAHEPVGKYFEGRSTEYTVSIFLDLIDVETGESATGYPQQVAPTQANFSIVSGGWARIKAWSVTSNASQVSITIERFNPTYTKPVESTCTSVSVTPSDALQSYLNTSYYIDGGAGESVLLQSLTATANGTYTAPARTAYNEVMVNVPAPAIVTKHIRGNGIFSAADDNVAGYSDVIVDGSPDAAFFNIITLTDPAHLTVTFASPAGKNYTGDFLITWGDGSENTSITTAGNGSISHTYPSVGTYGVMLYPIDAAFKVRSAAEYNSFFQNAVIEYAKIPNTMASFIENEPWFYGDQNFKSVSVPDNVTKLANGMFAQYSVLTLKTVYMRSTTPPTFPQDSWADPFSGCNLEAIYVPTEAVNAYKTASGWSTYADIIQPMPL